MDFDFKEKKHRNLDTKKINREIDRFDFVSTLNKYSKILTYFWIPYLGLIVAVVISYAFVLARGAQHTISSPWIAFYVFLAICILFSIVSLFLEVMILIYSIKNKHEKKYLWWSIFDLFTPLIFSWIILTKSNNEMKKLRLEIQKDFQS